ncbi:MAG: hypothetical protein M3280_09765 [Actinomycetota bacterium]|nr:hypothetical protein [Actinomycetota bacterium]
MQFAPRRGVHRSHRSHRRRGTQDRRDGTVQKFLADVARLTIGTNRHRHDVAMSDMSAEELAARLEEAADEIQELMRSFGAHEPDWEPLEKVLPLEECPGFMFMGYHQGIRLYKHGFTRNYLFVDSDGNTYSYLPERESYELIPRWLAVELVFDGLEEMNVTRSTPYDDAAIAAKHKALAEAGWNVITVDASKPEDPAR